MPSTNRKDQTQPTSGYPLARVEHFDGQPNPNPWVQQVDHDDFVIRFWQSKAKGTKGEFHQLRMGQAFCNHFSISDTQLFYSQDANRVEALMQLYIQQPSKDEENDSKNI